MIVTLFEVTVFSPETVPSTLPPSGAGVTNLRHVFYGATTFNSANVSSWEVALTAAEPPVSPV